MATVLLMGAGFSKAAGSLLANEIFSKAPIGSSHERNNQVTLVLDEWCRCSKHIFFYYP